jgi:hypothetical protein
MEPFTGIMMSEALEIKCGGSQGIDEANKMVMKGERGLMRGKTCHVPDEGPVDHMDGVHGRAEALHVEITHAAER